MSEVLLQAVERRRKNRAIAVGVGLLAAFGAGLGISDAVLSDNSASSNPVQLAVGLAECSGGQPVEGVWVEAGPKSGFASFRQTASTDVVSYQLSLDQASYTIHVGCGGSPDNWATADYGTSQAPVNIPTGFLCEIPPNNQSLPKNHGVCEQVGVTLLPIR